MGIIVIICPEKEHILKIERYQWTVKMDSGYSLRSIFSEVLTKDYSSKWCITTTRGKGDYVEARKMFIVSWTDSITLQSEEIVTTTKFKDHDKHSAMYISFKTCGSRTTNNIPENTGESQAESTDIFSNISDEILKKCSNIIQEKHSTQTKISRAYATLQIEESTQFFIFPKRKFEAFQQYQSIEWSKERSYILLTAIAGAFLGHG